MTVVSVGAPVRTKGRWIGPAERPLFGWVTTPADGVSRGAALILPPLGYEYATTHRTLRTIAESLASAGWTALRLDYDGTGDSAGDQWDAERFAAWRHSVGFGVDELRRMGHEDVTVIGIRLGATLALLEGQRVRASRLVAWAPVVSGRRYVRELRVLGSVVEASSKRPDPDGAISLGGFLFDAETLRDLGAVDLEKLEETPAAAVLLIERPDQALPQGLAERLQDLDCDVDVRAIAGSERCLDEPAEYATVPRDIADQIVTWTTAASAHAPVTLAEPAPGDSTARIKWDGAEITEAPITLTARNLVGMVGTPDGEARATVVWANPGSETHIGPGRAWVEYSRALNRAGYRTIRLDSRGWGESPDADHGQAHPYDAHMADDLRAVAADLEARGWGPVVLAGLCAGAWMALDTARTTPLGGVIASNPQLYWEQGDPVEANIVTETHVRREGERMRIKQLAQFGVWSLLDVIGVRNQAGNVLHDINAQGTPTLLVFSKGDDGLEFLHDRIGRAFSRARHDGKLEVVELPGIDHGMHRLWLRHEVTDAILAFLATIANGRSNGREHPTRA
jgi:alpha-beta hydrolase superfamily lysophospholipase